MVSYTPQFKHKNNQKASFICAERCWMLYVPMWRHQQRREIVQSNYWLIHTNSGLHIKTCELLFNRIYGLQEKCKNMVMRFQSPLVYVLIRRVWLWYFLNILSYILIKCIILCYLSCDMRFPTMWCVRPAKAQTSLRIRAVWSEPLLVAWIFYEC